MCYFSKNQCAQKFPASTFGRLAQPYRQVIIHFIFTRISHHIYINCPQKGHRATNSPFNFNFIRTHRCCGRYFFLVYKKKKKAQMKFKLYNIILQVHVCAYAVAKLWALVFECKFRMHAEYTVKKGSVF